LSGTEERPGDASSGGGDDGVVARGRPPTSPCFIPREWGGSRGLILNTKTPTAVRNLHPQLPGIPLSQRGNEVQSRPLPPRPGRAEGRSPSAFFLSPKSGGSRGLILDTKTPTAVRNLHPQLPGIPLSQRGNEVQSRPLPPRPGRAERRSPSAFLHIPQEWGIKGVDEPPSAIVQSML